MMLRCAGYWLLALFLVLSGTSTSAQQSFNPARQDSLTLAVRRSQSDTTKIKLYHLLAENSQQNRPEVALTYEDSALSIAKKINQPEHLAVTLTNMSAIHRKMSDFARAYSCIREAIAISPGNPQWLSETYLEGGIALWRLSYYDSATHMLEKGLEVVKEYPDEYIEASLYNSMGNVKRQQNQYEEALALYIRATKLFEKKKNVQGLTQSLSNVGNLHNLMGDTEKALEYARQSLETAKTSNVKSSIAYSHALMGRIYRKQGKRQEALDAYLQAITLYRELQLKRELGETQLSIGNIYFDLENYKEALNRYKQSLTIIKSIPDTLLMTYVYVAAGTTMITAREKGSKDPLFFSAKTYIDSGLVIATKKNFATLRMDCYQVMSDIYLKEGNHKQGLYYYKRFVAAKDSLADVQNREAAHEIEARYQTEKKDDAIRILNTENELKATQQKYLLIFLGLVVVLALIIYNRYKVKQRANEKLKELDQVKSRFFTNVSHEFRTPLSLIIGPLEEKLRNSRDQEEREKLLLMHRNASRLLNLINQVLDLSRIEAGNMELHLEEGDLSRELRFISSAFSSFAERKGIVFKAEIFEQSYNGCFDSDKLEKILNNLLSNAFKFTQAGGAVSMKAAIENDVLIIEVKDSGTGIPEEKINMIFNRFYQADDSISRSSEGSGIGLALAKELAELHRGKLSVSSTEGIGSVFTCTLPVSRNAYRGLLINEGSQRTNAFHLTKEPAPAIRDIDDDESKPLILVAEDNNDMQKFIYDLLKEKYRVVTVGNGREALERSQAIVPDLVISDWMMPVMDGRTLCEKLKTAETTCHIPLLMLTARADQPSKLEGLETGADDYLIKPFDTNELSVRIHNLIEQRKKLRQVFSRELVLQPQQITLPSRDAVFLSRVMAQVEENYANPDFSVEELSEAVNMSRMQLHRKMKALTDQSPGDFLRRFRLERARQMLAVAGTQVSEVCFKVGYNNVSNFSRAFREYSGVTPSEFIDSNGHKS